MSEKIKILVLSDHPLSPSGVGIQTKYMIEDLLKTGKYKFVCFGGAVKHQDYTPVRTEEYGDDWIIFPTDGYGTDEMVRSVIRGERPDILWFMTDPRFYEWLWMIENEVRPILPMVYYHVWDNYPYPHFNRKFYRSNDVIVAISKVTHDIVQKVVPEVESHYLPHAVDPEIFKKLDEIEVQKFKRKMFNGFEEEDENQNMERMIFFWNNRNARRKQSGTILWWFKEFLDKIGHENASLIMHTDPRDPHGQDLHALMEELELVDGQVILSTEKIDPVHLSMMYNLADCTVNISDAEGFGLSTLESLSCETPIIVNMTGGLQEQVTDGEEWFGIGIEPASKAVIGSQLVPFIYEDRVSKEDFIDSLEKMYSMLTKKPEDFRDLGKKGRGHVLKNYNFEDYGKRWDKVLSSIYKKYGSWENRKNYKGWELIEVRT